MIMIGAVAGDIIGSVFERGSMKSEKFPLFTDESRFTDDTVLTVAAASAILGDGNYTRAFRAFGRKYPNAGYGGTFYKWIFSDENEPYGSWGNGSAMRVSPVGFAFDSVETVLAEAEKSAAVTHNHPEGIKGAQATALAVFLARTGSGKAEIRDEITRRFGYDLKRRLAKIRMKYSFDVSCQGSVPEAIIAFLESESVEDAIRKAVSLGGDTDTQACIAGGIAHAFYKEISPEIVSGVRARLPQEFIEIMDRFQERYMV